MIRQFGFDTFILFLVDMLPKREPMKTHRFGSILKSICLPEHLLVPFEVMEHFIKHSCSSKDNPSLLYDNHESHLSIRVLDLAKENGVTIVTFPPHSTNKLQPLDVGIF